MALKSNTKTAPSRRGEARIVEKGICLWGCAPSAQSATDRNNRISNPRQPSQTKTQKPAQTVRVMKKQSPVSTLLLVLALPLLLLSQPTFADEWTGNGTSLNWSDTGNWTGGTPTAAGTYYFSDVFYPNAYTNAAGAVNTIVNGNYAAGRTIFNALSSSTLGTHFYTTLIPGGNTLTLGGLGGVALAVGDEVPTSFFNTSGPTNYTSFTGTGTLSINDSSAVVSVGTRNRATLNLTDLNLFTANSAKILVAGAPENPNANAQTGWLLMAKTNNFTTAANSSAPGIVLGHATNGNPTAVVELGRVNNFNTDGLIVGGRRSSSTFLRFGVANQYGANTGTFRLRGSAGGASAISTFGIGDFQGNTEGYDIWFPGTSSSANGTADFSGGTVDIIADSIYIGRGSPAIATNQSGSGVGTLIVEQGTITANNLYLGFKPAFTNNTGGQGTLTLRSNAVMNVANDVVLVRRTVGSAFLNESQINVRDNALLTIGGSLTSTNIGSGTRPSLNLAGGTVGMTGGGFVNVPAIIGFGSLTNASNILVTNTLSAGSATAAGTLTLGNNLTLSSAVPLTFNLGINNTVGGGINDYISVANNIAFNSNPLTLTFGGPLVTGTYTLFSYGGSQSGSVAWSNPTRSPIGLVQGAGQVALVVTNSTPASLTWRSSGASGNWGAPLVGTGVAATNWNANTERFVTLDSVLFDDTGIASGVVVTNVVVPGSMTFNNSSVTYTVSQSGSGRISGFTGLTKNGTGILNFGGSTVNDFTGPVNINAGTLVVNQFNTSLLGTNSGGQINIASGGTFDLKGGTIGGSSQYGKAVTVAGTGAGGAGALAHTGTGSPTLVIDSLTLTDHATFNITNGASGSRLILNGTFAPYSGLVNLAGYTLTVAGNREVRFTQVTMTNSGTIEVTAPSLSLGNSIIAGAGPINLNDKVLFLNSWTTGYLAKAITVNNGFFSTVSATATPLLIGSPITLYGGLTYTCLQPTRLTNVISGIGSLAKYGNTNLTLEAANTYSGATLISAGRLTLTASGSLVSTPILVDAELDVTAHISGYPLVAGQTLSVGTLGQVLGNVTVSGNSFYAGSGTNLGSVTVASGGTLSLGDSLNAGTLVITNHLTFNGGTNQFKLGSSTTPGAGVNDLVIVGGDLSFTAPTVINVLPVGSVAPGAYTLFQYSGTLSGIANLSVTSTLRPGTIYTLDTSVPGEVRLTVASASANLLWSGNVAGNPNAWDINTTSNWNNGGLPDYFFQGDRVTFDDSASTTLATISKQMQPAGMTNNATGSMVLNGAGNLLAGNLVANSGNFVIANTNNNLFNGEGIIFNGGAVTFNQPTTASVAGKLTGFGTLNKNGANTLTVTSADATNLSAAIKVNGGTLRAGSRGVLGSGNTTVASGATLDVNGQVLVAGAVEASGNGIDGQGAINNRGLLTQTNAIDSLSLLDHTTLGAASNRWDVLGLVTGNGYDLTKVGAADIVLNTTSDSGLGNINVNVGRLIFAGQGNDLGSSGTITVAAGATNAFAGNITAGAKPMNILSNGVVAGVNLGTGTGSNSFAGPITLNTNAGPVIVDNLVELNLAGNITGTGTLIAGSRGNLTLSGTNNYRGGTVVRLGQLTVASSGALPTNSPVILTNIGVPSSDNTFINLRDGAVTPATAPLTMYSSRSGSGTLSCGLTGDGTWGGPLAIRTLQIATANEPQVNFSGGGVTGLTVMGNVDGTNQIGSVNITGLKQTFNGSLVFGATVSIGNNGLGDATGETMTRVTFAGKGVWTNTFVPRALITLGTDNALPPNAPIQVGTLTAGTIIHLIGFDLNGYNQTISSLSERFVTTAFNNDTVWFYNNSTNTDSTLTYAGTGTNTWSAGIADNLDSSNPLGRKLGLSVTSGRLILEYVATRATNAFNYYPDFTQGTISNTYTGPTLVSGGALIVNSELGLTPVTVSGTGLFGGTGVISGPITIASGGTLAPGRSIGTLTANSNLVLQAGGKCEFEVNLVSGQTDKVVGLNHVAYGGTLIITNIGAQPFTNGTALSLFSAASYSAGAVTIQPASPGTGLMWDASDLAVNGTLKVVPAVAPVVSSPTRLPSGNISFNLTGVPGQGYSVRASTNVALPLGSWTVLSSGSLPSAVSTFTDLTATNFPSRYYRASTP
jgi:autotransporter-associated beta strand protein